MANILITNFHPDTGGGHETYIKSLLKIQDHSAHIIGVAAPQASRLFKSLKAIDYPHLFACDFPAKPQKEPLDIIKNIIKFKVIVHEFNPDIVHTNGVDLLIVNIVRLISGHYKIIRTHHATKNLSRDFYHNWLYNKRVSLNLYVSEKAKLASSEGLNIINYLVIENCVDLSHFKPTEKPNDLFKKLELDTETFCFGSIAGTAHYKRVDAMIEAGLILKTLTSNKFKIIALGNEISGAKLLKLAAQKGLKEFTLISHQEDVRPYIALFDVGFILSDKIETISYAAREMMAMGKPLISNNFSGLVENIVHLQNGILVNTDNPHEIAQAMLFFMNLDADSIQLFSHKAREFAEYKFDLTQQINRHIHAYQQVLNL